MKVMHDDKKIRGIINSVDDLETEKATLSDVETLLASGDVEDIKADSIVENMTGYTFTKSITEGVSCLYAGVVKNGNKLTFVITSIFTPASEASSGAPIGLGKFVVPADIAEKLVPFTSQTLTNVLDIKSGTFNSYVVNSRGTNLVVYKNDYDLNFVAYPLVPLAGDGNTPYYIRFEATFLLSNNLAAE